VRFDVTVVAAAIVAASIACSDTPTSNKRSSAAQITVADNYFTPASATIAAGDTVIWIWGGSAGHDVQFSTGGAPAGCGATSSGVCIRAFPTAGTYSYFCSFHSGMNGTIIVN
jgi:plastocyanin